MLTAHSAAGNEPTGQRRERMRVAAGRRAQAPWADVAAQRQRQRQQYRVVIRGLDAIAVRA
jgi:hypothetical protein